MGRACPDGKRVLRYLCNMSSTEKLTGTEITEGTETAIPSAEEVREDVQEGIANAQARFKKLNNPEVVGDARRQVMTELDHFISHLSGVAKQTNGILDERTKKTIVGLRKRYANVAAVEM